VTAPAAARQNSVGGRVYPVPVPGEDQVRDLPAVSQLLRSLAAPGLEIWKQKLIAEQFSQRPDLIMLAADPSTRYDAIKQALDGSRNAANTGTAVHRFTEMVDDGTLDWSLIPEVAKPWVEHYAQAKEDYGWEMVAKEFTVYNHEIGYAGTSDSALRIPGYGTVICDTKTGKEIYGDQALQLSFYAHGEGIWVAPAPDALTEYLKASRALQEDVDAGVNIPEGRRKWSADAVKIAKSHLEEAKWREYAERGTHLPMPADLRKDVGFIIHLTDKKCEVVPMDLVGTEAVIRGIANIFWWKARKDIVGQPLVARKDPTPAPAPPAPPAEPVPVPVADEAPLATRIEAMQARITALPIEAKKDLIFRWPEGVPTFKQSRDHTEAQVQAIDTELWAVECKFAPVATRAVLEERTARVMEAFPGSVEEPF
jgi:hypothetical protein